MRFQTQVTSDNLLQFVEDLRVEVYYVTDKATRSEKGQFFTPPHVAALMASFFSHIPQNVSLMDPGAGIGMLTAAYVANVVGTRYSLPARISATVYETEEAFLPFLERTMLLCSQLCQQYGITFNFEIRNEDFIGASAKALAPSLFEEGHLQSYNTIIVNPPYRKINNASKTKKLLRTMGVNTTNMYTAFLWIGAKLLEEKGEMVSITPRSFCNGPYFLPFRRYFLDHMAVRKIHVFEERDKVFSEDDVLQENVILLSIRNGDRDKVHITSSVGPEDDFIVHTVPYDQLVIPDDARQIIHISTNEYQSGLRTEISHLTSSLHDLGLNVSTGKVVDFRAKTFLAKPDAFNVVPLIYPAHFSNGFVVWPMEKLRKPTALRLENGVEKLLVPKGCYVLVRRFSAKEEKRRITAAVYDPEVIPHDFVGFENHLNYYHSNGKGLPPELAKGLTLYLNSTLVDAYFRQFSGHTQVNANDLRNIRYPDIETLLRMGRRVKGRFPEQEEIDRIIAEELGMTDQVNSLQAQKKIDEALDILKSIGVPRGQQNQRSALTLLALLDLRPDTEWRNASAPLRGITEMMNYFREHYGINYAPNTRETVRRQTIHQFWVMGLIVANPDKPDRPINSPDYCYQVKEDFLELARSYNTNAWEASLKRFKENAGDLRKLTPLSRGMKMIPVTLPDGSEIQLTAGGQNKLIKQVIEEFCPRYTPNGKVIYLGDAGSKLTIEEKDALEELGIELDVHGKAPDVIVHMQDRNWLFIIEAVTSHGPIDVKRHNELKEIFKNCDAGLVFVTAFDSRRAMSKYLPEISWETEVWIAEAPDHLIHFDGERFLGPYN